jgi:chromosome segregation ATPase
MRQPPGYHPAQHFESQERLRMLTVNKLEKIIELEDQLRGEYEEKLAARDRDIAELNKLQAEMQVTIDKQKATIDKQLETISELSGKATLNQRSEQLNRELNNRSDKLQEEVGSLKKRVKTLQRDLAQEREENKQLKQFDAIKLKKNLDANKKKLAEKTRATDLLQKSINKAKAENADLEARVKELEAKVTELEAGADAGAEQGETEAAA